MRLTGLIGRPGVGRATRHEMVVFVNQRPVDSRTLNYALIESYHESLPKGRYPLAFVFFECDPAQVDVNVHPAKREVRFRSEPAVRAFVIRCVLGRLRELTMAAGPAEATPPVMAAKPAATAPQSLRPSVSGGAVPWAGRLTAPLTAVPGKSTPPMVTPSPETGSVAKTPGATPSWRFLGLAHGNYALFETLAGLVMLDRRASHERVWFERLQNEFKEGQVPSQRLLLPVPVELDPIASALLLDRLDFLTAHGFEIVEFGRNFFRIEALPTWMEPAEAEPFMRDLLALLREGRLQGKNLDLAREELARLAVAKAVRLSDQASETEVRSLLTQLFATRHPLSSPAGRPTYIELNHAELARRFQKLT